MEITWYGQSCFRLKGKETVIVTDPYAPMQGMALNKVTADIVSISCQEPDHNYVQGVAGISTPEPKVVRGPGEYEMNNVLITAVASTLAPVAAGAIAGALPSSVAGFPPRNTVFVFLIDDVIVCHLGALGKRLSSEEQEAIGPVDVLIVPVGGGHSLNFVGAVEAVSDLEPKIVIPMHYAVGDPNQFALPGEGEPLETLEKFAHEMGMVNMEPQARLTINKSSLVEDAPLQVMLLAQRS